MATSTLRSVGGSVMMTIPKPMLDALGLSANDKVSLSVDGGRLVVQRPRPAYKLAELIAQCDPSAEASDDMADWDNRTEEAIEGTNLPLPPIKAFHRAANGHCNAAHIVHSRLLSLEVERTESTWIALQHNLGFAFECTLKSYLSYRGVSNFALKNKSFGHNLKNMFDEALNQGLTTDVFIADLNIVECLSKYIKLCGNDYSSFNFRYIDKSKISILSSGMSTEIIIRALREILEFVGSKIEDELPPN